MNAQVASRAKCYALCTPLLKKRTPLLRRLQEIFCAHRSQPVERVIETINPILRGWVNYFARGNASYTFSHVRQWNDYTGTKPETAETAKSEPTEYRAGPRPY